MALLQAVIAFFLSFGSPALWKLLIKAIDSKTGGDRDIKSLSLLACFISFLSKHFLNCKASFDSRCSGIYF